MSCIKDGHIDTHSFGFWLGYFCGFVTQLLCHYREGLPCWIQRMKDKLPQDMPEPLKYLSILPNL